MATGELVVDPYFFESSADDRELRVSMKIRKDVIKTFSYLTVLYMNRSMSL